MKTPENVGTFIDLRSIPLGEDAHEKQAMKYAVAARAFEFTGRARAPALTTIY